MKLKTMRRQLAKVRLKKSEIQCACSCWLGSAPLHMRDLTIAIHGPHHGEGCPLRFEHGVYPPLLKAELEAIPAPEHVAIVKVGACVCGQLPWARRGLPGPWHRDACPNYTVGANKIFEAVTAALELRQTTFNERLMRVTDEAE